MYIHFDGFAINIAHITMVEQAGGFGHERFSTICLDHGTNRLVKLPYIDVVNQLEALHEKTKERT